MSIKTKDSHKFFIEQFTLNDPNILVSERVNELLTNNVIIGYLFFNKGKIKLMESVDILTLYLIDKRYYDKEIISIKELNDAWNEYIKYNKQKPIFKNPPLKEWLDTKDNWCKKLAGKISKQFGWTFDEALSEIYFIITKCYNKPHVYFGNLGYIQTSIINSIKMYHRNNVKRLNYTNPKVISIDSVVSESSDGVAITIADTIGCNDNYYNEEHYNDFEKEIKLLLSKTFSEREIEQILKNSPSYLPQPLYTKLLRWRKKHSVKEVLNEYK